MRRCPHLHVEEGRLLVGPLMRLLGGLRHGAAGRAAKAWVLLLAGVRLLRVGLHIVALGATCVEACRCAAGVVMAQCRRTHQLTGSQGTG